MLGRPALALCMAAGAVACQAGTEPTEAEKAYLDLVFGYCLDRHFGQSLRDETPTPDSWPQAASWADSRIVDPAADDVRVLVIGDGQLLVDVKRVDACRTQASGVDVAALSALIRREVMESPHRGAVLGETVEQTPDGGGAARETTYALVEWADGFFPVIIVRAPTESAARLLAVDVVRAESSQ